MKIINSKSIAATLILAAGVIPAFGQMRGHGSERGSDRGGHSQFQRGSQRGDSFRNRAVPQSRGDARQYGGSSYRNESGARREYNSRGNSFGGARHYVIPQNRFYSSFGRQHYFRIGRPVFYGRSARFQYGGFWFNFAGAAPAYWGPDWYNSDDVYIDYSDGGYYLYDNRYPGQGVPLEVDSGDGSGAPADGTYDGSYGSY
ncbi:MAG TPA: hypothetical protein VGM43_27085 [Bryobacteraceae bacterium]|jgi:hypothetical protein